MAFVTSSVFAVKACYYGLGTRDVDLNAFLMVRCAEYMLYSQVTYGVSMPLIKASVVFTLVRITTNKWYRWSLYAMQFLATIMALIGILASLLYCRPTPAYWNPLLGTCGNFMVVVNIGYAWTAVGIITDWTCAILPYFIIRKLQMSRRSKNTVMVILGLAAVASTATIVRAPYLQYYLVEEDRLCTLLPTPTHCCLQANPPRQIGTATSPSGANSRAVLPSSPRASRPSVCCSGSTSSLVGTRPTTRASNTPRAAVDTWLETPQRPWTPCPRLESPPSSAASGTDWTTRTRARGKSSTLGPRLASREA